MFIIITNTSGPTPYFVSNDGTDDGGVSGDINNPFQTLKLFQVKNYKSRHNIF